MTEQGQDLQLRLPVQIDPPTPVSSALGRPSTPWTYRHEVFHHIHVREWIDLGDLVEVGVDPLGTSQSVRPVDVHGARATNACGRQRQRFAKSKSRIFGIAVKSTASSVFH